MKYLFAGLCCFFVGLGVQADPLVLAVAPFPAFATIDFILTDHRQARP